MNEILSKVKDYFHNNNDEQNVVLINEIINLAVYERVNYAIDSSDLVQSIYGKIGSVYDFDNYELIKAVNDRNLNITQVFDEPYIHDVALENGIVTADDFKDELYDEVRRLIEDGDCSPDHLFDDDELIECVTRNHSIDEIADDDEIVRYAIENNLVEDYIKQNVAIEDVYDDYTIQEYCKDNYYPEDVYDDEDLERWCEKVQKNHNDLALDIVIKDLRDGEICLGDVAPIEDIIDYVTENIDLLDVVEYKRG